MPNFDFTYAGALLYSSSNAEARHSSKRDAFYRWFIWRRGSFAGPPDASVQGKLRTRAAFSKTLAKSSGGKPNFEIRISFGLVEDD